MCLVLVSAAACRGQGLTFVVTPQDFQHKKDKVKRTNLEYFSHCGLMLRDRMQPGKLESEPIELSPGTLALILQWMSSLPPDGPTFRVQVSKDANLWSQWLPASEQVQFNRPGNFYFGQRVTGFGEVRYVRYEAEIKPEPPPIVPGCLASVRIVSATASLPAIQNGKKYNCSVNGGCRPAQ
jgi:hypothetical protein